MQTPSLRSARDYNRALAAPVRWTHVAAAAVRPVWTSLTRGRERWARPLLISIPFVLVLLPFDGAIARFCERHPLGGDVRRELEALQQYGQAVSTALIALVIWIQDPPRRRLLLNWAAALACTFIVVFAVKTLLGRPRPEYDDPWFFLGPLGQYPIGPGRGVHHAWEFWAGISSKLWSMPSSHTAYAFAMAVFLASLYPRLRAVVFSLAAVVGLSRVLTHAHYPTDVLVGAAMGLAMTRAAIAGSWGVRLLARRSEPATA
jgi:membrane-associated phospholipid phosphatase